MSTCPRHARLLEADPLELDGESDSELARHVAVCAECAAAAAAILAARRELDRALSTRPDFDPGVLVTSALEAPPARKGRTVPRWVPLLAAAAVAGLLLVPRIDRGPAGPATSGPAGAFMPALRPPDVAAPAGTDFAVLGTDDPDITVIWLFQGDE